MKYETCCSFEYYFARRERETTKRLVFVYVTGTGCRCDATKGVPNEEMSKSDAVTTTLLPTPGSIVPRLVPPHSGGPVDIKNNTMLASSQRKGFQK